MAYKYTKQVWNNYNNALEASDQPHAIITKQRLDHMEEGIQYNSMELVAICKSDTVPGASFSVDTVNKRKVLNITFPILKLEPPTRTTYGGVMAKERDYEDMETAIGVDGRLYTGVLRSPNGSRFKIVVDDNGNLSTEKVI